MQKIRFILAQYNLRDVYNGDETTYCWRLQPDKGLVTHKMKGKKKGKQEMMGISEFLDPVGGKAIDTPKYLEVL